MDGEGYFLEKPLSTWFRGAQLRERTNERTERVNVTSSRPIHDRWEYEGLKILIVAGGQFQLVNKETRQVGFRLPSWLVID